MSTSNSSESKERLDRRLSRLWNDYNEIFIGIILYLLIVFVLGALIYGYFENDIGLFLVIGFSSLLLICVCLFLGVVCIITLTKNVCQSQESSNKT